MTQNVEKAGFGAKVVDFSKDLYDRTKGAVKKGYESSSIFVKEKADYLKDTNDGMTSEMKTSAGLFGIGAVLKIGSEIAMKFVKNQTGLNVLKSTGSVGVVIGFLSAIGFVLNAVRSNTEKNKELKIIDLALNNSLNKIKELSEQIKEDTQIKSDDSYKSWELKLGE